MLTWVFDTGSVAHICNSMQGMTNNRSIERGEVDFRIGNNARVAALAIGQDLSWSLVIVILFQV